MVYKTARNRQAEFEPPYVGVLLNMLALRKKKKSEFFYGVRGSAVVCGITLQDGRSRARFPKVILEFFIDIILPASL